MSIKILHTSDWHIGKQLSRIDFSEDMNMFFDWLIELIEKQSIDVLLMSGDLFDQANPSQQAMRQYYLFLKRMVKLDCKVVLTGGNHDSVQVLNAPKELLKILDFKIIGGAPDEISELFIEVEKNEERLVIAAVPYLRDKDIRQSVAGETYDDKISQMRIGLRNYFESINSYYSANFSNLPFVMMGHLFVQGVSISESEREIQIGNQASIEANVFGDKANYVALGHIHRPQIVGSEHIRYCGSPIPMGFGEAKQSKCVYIIDFTNGKKIETIEIPVFQKLESIVGDKTFIANRIEELKKLSSSVWVEIIYNGTEIFTDFSPWANELTDGSKIEILKLQNRKHLTEVLTTGDTTSTLEGLNSTDVFDKLLEKTGISDEQKVELKKTYKEIVDGLNIKN